MLTTQLLVLILACFHQAICATYFIAPACMDTELPSLNGTPCYSLHQLNETLLSHQSSVILFLLPGTHMIPKNHTITALSVGELVIRSWDGQKVVDIGCQSVQGIKFEYIGELNISFINFKSCKLSCWSSRPGGSMVISSCVFDGLLSENLTDSSTVVTSDPQFKIKGATCDTIFGDNCRNEYGGAIYSRYINP